MARDELSFLLKTKYTAGPLTTVQNTDELARQIQAKYNLNVHIAAQNSQQWSTCPLSFHLLTIKDRSIHYVPVWHVFQWMIKEILVYMQILKRLSYKCFFSSNQLPLNFMSKQTNSKTNPA